ACVTVYGKRTTRRAAGSIYERFGTRPGTLRLGVHHHGYLSPALGLSEDTVPGNTVPARADSLLHTLPNDAAVGAGWHEARGGGFASHSRVSVSCGPGW